MSIRKVAATRVYIDAPYNEEISRHSEHKTTFEHHSSLPLFHTNHVVELTDHIVTNHYPLTTELPHTEWLGGTIIIKDRHAYHFKKVLSPDEASSTTTNFAKL